VVLTLILGALALLSWTLTVWQWVVAWRFPLHQRATQPAWAPPATVLKPLKGVDEKTEECLRSWLDQQYGGEMEILFGVASATDPVCELVRLVISHKKNARLVICPEELGANAKVSTLIQLMREVRNDMIILSDADVWVPQDFLAELVASIKEPNVGLVNCFYRMAPSTNLAMRWEAFVVNADFWSQVLQSLSLKPMDFALGAVMATTRAHLEKIGGFETLADYLADDYELGHQIARFGGIALCPFVVECRNGPMTWAEVWAHQIRWARTIRVCQPVPYLLSQLQNGTLWPCLWAAWQGSTFAFAVAAGLVGTRMAAASYCEQKLTRRWDFNSLWLAPLKDLLQIVIWALAFFGNRITWRGQRFLVRRGGRLVKC
jgi:ceramide glucosyltransferase